MGKGSPFQYLTELKRLEGRIIICIVMHIKKSIRLDFAGPLLSARVRKEDRGTTSEREGRAFL